MNNCHNTRFVADRRSFLRQTSAGFGALALSALHANWTNGPIARRRGTVRLRRPARAEAAALCGSGQARDLPLHGRGPVAYRHVRLEARAGEDVARRQIAAAAAGVEVRAVRQERADAGRAICFRILSKQADELCLLNGVQTKNNGHMQSIAMIHTGTERFVRPSLGAWTVYGLGTEAEDLPGFVTLDPISHNGGAQLYGSAFLPAMYQGTRLAGVARGHAEHRQLAPRRRAINAGNSITCAG